MARQGIVLYHGIDSRRGAEGVRRDCRTLRLRVLVGHRAVFPRGDLLHAGFSGRRDP